MHESKLCEYDATGIASDSRRVVTNVSTRLVATLFSTIPRCTTSCMASPKCRRPLPLIWRHNRRKMTAGRWSSSPTRAISSWIAGKVSAFSLRATAFDVILTPAVSESFTKIFGWIWAFITMLLMSTRASSTLRSLPHISDERTIRHRSHASVQPHHAFSLNEGLYQRLGQESTSFYIARYLVMRSLKQNLTEQT